MTESWRLDDARQTLVLTSRDARCPQIVYWGAPLPPDEDLDALAQMAERDVTGGMLDETPELSLCPETARGFPGQPGLDLRDRDGAPLRPLFVLEEAV